MAVITEFTETNDSNFDYIWEVTGYFSHYRPATRLAPAEGGILEKVEFKLIKVLGFAYPLYYHKIHAVLPSGIEVETAFKTFSFGE